MKSLFYSSVSYYFLRALFFPLYFLPYRWIHFIGKRLGTLAYWFAPKKVKKTTYHNLALASKLNLSEKQIKQIAKESFQNLIINGLEYFKLKSSRNNIGSFVTPYNLKIIEDFHSKGQGVICVTGHMSNWELCFLQHTQNYPAKAIGKKIKNQKLYDYILSIREMHQGKIVEMKNAITKGIEDLKKGRCYTMVNDQAYTSSSYHYPFLGVRAWTSAAPALLAYRSNSPVVPVVTERLKKGKYEFTLCEPIWPDLSKPLKSEVCRMMDEVMAVFEKQVEKTPGQWLWQHKRWKQEGFNYIIHEYKAESLLIILPDDEKLFDWISQGAWIFEQIYTRSFLTFMIPEKYKEKWPYSHHETITYKRFDDLLIRDYRFQLIYDFYENSKIKEHYFKLSAQKAYTLSQLLDRATFNTKEMSFDQFLGKLICLPEAKFKEPIAHS